MRPILGLPVPSGSKVSNYRYSNRRNFKPARVATITATDARGSTLTASVNNLSPSHIKSVLDSLDGRVSVGMYRGLLQGPIQGDMRQVAARATQEATLAAEGIISEERSAA